ncbi:MAG: AAC(3) family N-acetyltransferase [Pseudomonadales bacterium]|nr:AAC(3) family N-acetyltransferase [Pseudomonadales bacterium]
MSPQRTPHDPARPVTLASLRADLERLGVRRGATVLVHTRLSAVGYVVGGGPSVFLHALLESLGPEGTLLMPAHNRDLSEPAHWSDPPVDPALHAAIRAGMPPWDPERTASRGMGVVAELFRRWPGVRRSGHPQTSFAALGPAADDLLAGHGPGCALGERSPLGALYRADGEVLLVGVDHGRNTSLHLAEYRARWPGRREHEEGAPLLVDGAPRWVRFPELAFDDGDFARLGADHEAAGGPVAVGPVGHAESRLLPQRPLVDFAVRWLEAHR